MRDSCKLLLWFVEVFGFLEHPEAGIFNVRNCFICHLGYSTRTTAVLTWRWVLLGTREPEGWDISCRNVRDLEWPMPNADKIDKHN